MNQYSKQSRFIVAMLSALLVVAATWMVRHPSDATRIAPTRKPSSIENGLRMEVAKKAQLDEFLDAEPLGKVSGNFTVTIRGDDGSGAPIDDLAIAPTHVRLTGTITAGRPIINHEYSWILPGGYRASNGGLTGKLPDLSVGQSYEVSVTIDRDQVPLQPIVLHVFKLVNAEARGQVAQFDIPDAKSTMKESEEAARGILIPEPERKYVQ